jgi:hypothetical protein
MVVGFLNSGKFALRETRYSTRQLVVFGCLFAVRFTPKGSNPPDGINPIARTAKNKTLKN